MSLKTLKIFCFPSCFFVFLLFSADAFGAMPKNAPKMRFKFLGGNEFLLASENFVRVSFLPSCFPFSPLKKHWKCSCNSITRVASPLVSLSPFFFLFPPFANPFSFRPCLGATTTAVLGCYFFPPLFSRSSSSLRRVAVGWKGGAERC